MCAPSMPPPSDPSTRLSRVAAHEACLATSTSGRPYLVNRPRSGGEGARRQQGLGGGEGGRGGRERASAGQAPGGADDRIVGHGSSVTLEFVFEREPELGPR